MGARIEDIPHYTYDDYKLFEGKWELIYGYPYMMAPMPTIKHQKISNNISWQLRETLNDCKECQALLPVDWKIAEDTIVQPDNLVICHKPINQNYLIKAPVIIFEILSKSTARKDLTIKFDLYEREGVNYYIIVNPDDNIAKVYKLNDGKYNKVADATNEKVTFELKCGNKEFDFSQIW